jgi:hypothetical protein
MALGNRVCAPLPTKGFTPLPTGLEPLGVLHTRQQGFRPLPARPVLVMLISYCAFTRADSSQSVVDC